MFTLHKLLDEIDGGEVWLNCPLCIQDSLGKLLPITSVAFVVTADGRRVLVMADELPDGMPKATQPTVG